MIREWSSGTVVPMHNFHESLSTWGTLDDVVPKLIRRPFSLSGIEKILQQPIRKIRKTLLLPEPTAERAVLPFLSLEEAEKLQCELTTLETRAAIAAALRERVGTTLTLQQAQLPDWETEFAHLLPEDPDERDERLHFYQERFVTDAVSSKYIRRITGKKGMRSTPFMTLMDALETREGIDAITLMEQHLSWAILDALLPEPDDAAATVAHPSLFHRDGA